ncbi:MAG: hypothetical protein K2X47_15105, partial [Bdellovibrionales bacterium]|nr:hypothetical protein [Bdellovibrionales bacterium]
KYYVYVPTKYKEDTPIGMVLVFHGVTNEPSDYFQILRDFANADRFLMIAPAGDPGDGAGGAYCQPFAREIMEAARAAFNVDDSKQYITGHSAGSNSTVYLALTSEKRTAKNACGQDIKIGFQSEFAGIGFSSPVASVPGAAFISKTAEQLGFIPAMWSEYGEFSADGAKATALSQFGKSKGYSPSTLVERKGEGHTPNQPFPNYKRMFDLFETTRKSSR